MNRNAFLHCILVCGLMQANMSPLRAQDAAANPPALRSIGEIHKLPADQLSNRVPVDMECVVAFYSSDWPILFLHDGVVGMYAGGPNSLSIRTGDTVRVRGVVGPGRFVVDYTLEPSDNGVALPAPKRTEFQRLHDGLEDSQYVGITGQLVSVQTDTDHTVLEMNASGGGRFRALIPQALASTEQIKQMLGRQLALQGTAGVRLGDSAQVIGFQLWLGALSEITVLPQQSPNDIVPRTPISDLALVPQVRGAASFFRVHARVDYVISDHMVVVHDESGTLFVELKDTGSVKVGSSYEIGGVLDAGMVPPILRFAEPTGVIPPVEQEPDIITLSLSELVGGKLSGRVVSTRGEYVGGFSLGNDHGFLLRSENNLLPVFIHGGELEDISRGTDIHVTGVWVQQRSLIGFNIGSCALYTRLDGIVVGNQIPWTIVSVLAAAGLIAMVSFLWAVTLRRQVQVQTSRVLNEYASRRQMEERYANIFINAQVMVITATSEGTILAVNPASVRTIGRSESSLVESRLQDLVAPECRAEIDSLLATALRSTDCSSRDVKVIGADGVTVSQEVSCWCTHEEGSTTIHSIWHDISHRLLVEEQKREFEHGMVYAQKMESLGVLAGGIAHDFNNLLTVIQGNASLLRDSDSLHSSSQESLGYIEMAAGRAAELTQQMLAYAGRGRFDVRALNLSQLIQDIGSLLSASVAKSTHLKFDLQEDLPTVMADATQLRQIVMNLVLNASESLNGAPGEVIIRTSVVECRAEDLEECIVSFASEPGAFVLLQVIDTGMGMSPQTIERMFDPFYSTKFSGRGLGLSTVLGIVRGHKGSIRVDAAQAIGTRFDVLLPASDETLQRISRPMLQGPLEVGHGSVLVVDDEECVLNFVCRTLQMAGLKATGVTRATDAIEHFSKDAPAYDCVITDLTMPEMNGDELSQRLLEIRPDIRIILCSGFNANEFGSDRPALAIAAFLKKPFNGRELVDLTLSLIAESRAVNLPSGPIASAF